MQPIVFIDITPSSVRRDSPADPMQEGNKMKVAVETDEAHRASSAGLVAAIRGIEQQPIPRHKIETVAVSGLKPYPANARTHAPTQIQHIADSITRFGFCNPILIDADNQIIAGHGRFEAAKLLGLQAVPALRLSHLSPSEKRAYLIADNRLAELAGWDRDMLATELQALLDCEFDVELTGFDLGEVESMLNTGKQAGSETADGQGVAKTSSGSAISQAGDDWLLGDHRLLCGASGDHCAYAAADAAIRHWEAFARQSAILAGTNKTFKEIEAERTKSRVRGAV